MDGYHDKCIRTAQQFTIDPKTNKVVWGDETETCECTKRGCKCYVPAKERTKAKAARRKK
jgi:hypothetical protein